MKKIFVFFIILIVSLSVFCKDKTESIEDYRRVPKSKIDYTKIAGNLKGKLENIGNDELIRINILFKKQHDSPRMLENAKRLTKKERRKYVINILRLEAEQTQENVRKNLERSETVKNIESHWISNSIKCYANKTIIERLTKFSNVKQILYDEKIQLILQGLETTEIKSRGTSKAWNILHTGIDSVWDAGYTGSGVIVAVLDTGINYDHNDLEDHMWIDDNYPLHGYNCVEDNNNPMDDNGHGTHCAGTVAGDGTSGIKTGAAPDATVMAIKVLDLFGAGTLTDIIQGIEFSITNNADVLSMSFGGIFSEAAARSLQRDVMDNALAAGIVAVVASGNSGQYYVNTIPPPYNVATPGSCPSPWEHPDQTLSGGLSAVITVGATDKNDNAASFSSRGPTTWQNVDPYYDYPYSPEMGLIKPDVVAPGVAITSLGYLNNSDYLGMFSGTSMATPLVAGLVALMLSKDSTLTPAEINQYLEESAKHITATKSNIYGSGRIQGMNTINAIP